jgi:beta-glucosidase/6-phospho-beta-glucosidase/beta-galactosidase
MMKYAKKTTDPVYFGKYPPAMIDRVGDRLPTFTPDESALLIRTAPKWFGLNHYRYVVLFENNNILQFHYM